MILKIDPKMVDTMLTLARDERALALQTVNTPPDDELGNEQEERGPRRGPRRRPAATIRANDRADGSGARACRDGTIGASIFSSARTYQACLVETDRCIVELFQTNPEGGRYRRRPMANLNKVMLIGRLTRDPEAIQVRGANAGAKFGFAVNNRKLNQDTQQWEEVPVFIDCEIWNPRREQAGRPLLADRPQGPAGVHRRPPEDGPVGRQERRRQA